MEGDATWTLAVLILLPILFALLAGALTGALIFFKAAKGAGYDSDLLYGGSGICAIIALGILIGTAWGYYPYKAEYHQFVTKVGTVQSIKSRLLGSSDSFQQKFVARFTDGREFGCEDTRCALVKPGDVLVLACKRTWQYAGTDGYDCNYLENRGKG